MSTGQHTASMTHSVKMVYRWSLYFPRSLSIRTNRCVMCLYTVLKQTIHSVSNESDLEKWCKLWFLPYRNTIYNNLCFGGNITSRSMVNIYQSYNTVSEGHFKQNTSRILKSTLSTQISLFVKCLDTTKRSSLPELSYYHTINRTTD